MLLPKGRHHIGLALTGAMSLAVATAAQPIELRQTAAVSLLAALGPNPVIREIVRGNAGFFVFVTSGPAARSQPRIVEFDGSGKLVAAVSLPALHHEGLGISAGGSLLLQRMESNDRALVEYGPDGSVLSRTTSPTPIRAFSVSGQDVSFVHSNSLASVSKIGASGGEWSRVSLPLTPSSLVLKNTPDGALLIVDQVEGTLEFVQFKTKAVVTHRIESPRIAIAKKEFAEYFSKLQALQGPGSRVVASGNVVASADVDATGRIFCLVAPVHASTGALVLELSREGRVLNEYLCPFKSQSPAPWFPSRLAVIGGSVWLFSPQGHAAIYGLPTSIASTGKTRIVMPE